jgi:hypothetical protein
VHHANHARQKINDVVDRAGDAEREALLARFEFAAARVQLKE